MDRTDIINAKTPLFIDVPEQLTKSTRRKNAYHCVFAEACARVPQVQEAIVHLSTAYIKMKGEKYFRRYRVSTRLRDQIVMFDRFGAFDPGLYSLGVIQPSHQARGRRQGTAGTGARTDQKRKRVFIKGVRAPANIATL
jgi:hypothetical protein